MSEAAIKLSKTEIKTLTDLIGRASYKELGTLGELVETLKEEKAVAEKDAMRKKLAEMAEAGGFALSDLVGRGSALRGSKVAAKYRDPNDPSKTWTGRGRMPRWLADATKGANRSLEDFAIKSGVGKK